MGRRIRRRARNDDAQGQFAPRTHERQARADAEAINQNNREAMGDLPNMREGGLGGNTGRNAFSDVGVSMETQTDIGGATPLGDTELVRKSKARVEGGKKGAKTLAERRAGEEEARQMRLRLSDEEFRAGEADAMGMGGMARMPPRETPEFVPRKGEGDVKPSGDLGEGAGGEGDF